MLQTRMLTIVLSVSLVSPSVSPLRQYRFGQCLSRPCRASRSPVARTCGMRSPIYLHLHRPIIDRQKSSPESISYKGLLCWSGPWVDIEGSGMEPNHGYRKMGGNSSMVCSTYSSQTRRPRKQKPEVMGRRDFAREGENSSFQ